MIASGLELRLVIAGAPGIDEDLFGVNAAPVCIRAMRGAVRPGHRDACADARRCVTGVVMPSCCLLAVVDLNHFGPERHLLDSGKRARPRGRPERTLTAIRQLILPSVRPGCRRGSPSGGRGDDAHP
jgi:hypothetical protein